MRKIFVFGSNLAGKHFGGSAREALQNRGAIMGQGIGLQGESYAIPTLDEDYAKLPLEDIKRYVDDFLAFAMDHRDMKFDIVAIGCGIAGFKPEDIAPMFASTHDNCVLPEEFISIITQ